MAAPDVYHGELIKPAGCQIIGVIVLITAPRSTWTGIVNWFAAMLGRG